MSKQFWIFAIAGLAIAGALVFFLLLGTKSAHLELTGKILKVRVLNLGPRACFVAADFRLTNPSGVPFVVRSLELVLESSTGEPASAAVSSKAQVDNVFQGARLIGTKYNDVLGLRDRVEPNRTIDRMAAGRFELPEAAVNARKSLRLRLEDVDGTTAEILETQP